jgi:hypothetical protein
MRAVDAWLTDAGLSKYAPAFAGVDDPSFLELMMQVRSMPRQRVQQRMRFVRCSASRGHAQRGQIQPHVLGHSERGGDTCAVWHQWATCG